MESSMVDSCNLICRCNAGIHSHTYGVPTQIVGETQARATGSSSAASVACCCFSGGCGGCNHLIGEIR